MPFVFPAPIAPTSIVHVPTLPPEPPITAEPQPLDILTEEQLRLGDHPAARAWAGHVAAGRIGVAPPPRPTDDGRDYGCASLARILARTGGAG